MKSHLKNKKLVLLMLCSIFLQCTLPAQGKAGIELYNYRSGPVIQPICHIQTKNNWYTELRYNYEDDKTFSLFSGKTFEHGNRFNYSITPMIGLSTGVFTGVSFGTNAEAEWNSLFFSSQSQYSHALKTSTSNFFFSWSEAGYSINDYLYAGTTMQYTLQDGTGLFEPGLLAGISIKNVSFPFYVFKPFSTSRYFILGINYECSFRKK